MMLIRAAFAVLLALGLAGPALAQAGASAAQEKTRGALVEACLKEVRGGLRPGQKQTAHQRMQAEEQCMARAEAAIHMQNTAPKR